MALVSNGISQVQYATLIGSAVSYVPDVVAKRVPISRSGEYLDENGRNVLYSGILLPMSDDGSEITGLLGAANCRELSQG